MEKEWKQWLTIFMSSEITGNSDCSHEIKRHLFLGRKVMTNLLLLLLLSHFSHVRLFTTPWAAAYQAPPSMGFSRQEYWSGVPLPSPMTNLDSILRSRDIALPTKIHLVKAMVFPVVWKVVMWMWKLDCKESRAPKNWCFWTVVLEKTLESPLDYKKIQPVHPKGN